LNFNVEKCDRLAIIGKNGRGKSTILRLLFNQLEAKSGKVVQNQNSSLAYFGQSDIERLDLKKTVEEEVMSAAPLAPYAKIRATCGVMMFSGDDAKKSISVLSGGERSRVLLAKILLTPANFLLLDEPTHHLDIESVNALMEAIERFPGAVIMVSHDEFILRKFKPHKLIICRNSEQELFLGDYDNFLEKGGWDDDSSASFGKTKSSNKEERRQRADFVKERADALRPIKNDIKRIEALITKYEQEKHALEASMISAAQAASPEIASLRHKHVELCNNIDALYDELQVHMEQEEIVNQKFQ